ncbi:hypothetical protein EC34870_2416B, partial [Escherichia coli 3.4870]
EKT